MPEGLTDDHVTLRDSLPRKLLALTQPHGLADQPDLEESACRLLGDKPPCTMIPRRRHEENFK